MFNIEPLSTTNLLTLLQMLIIIGGFYFSWRGINSTQESIALATKSLETASESLKLSANNAKAQLYNQMIVQGRDLQFKFVELYYSTDINSKKDQFLGTMLSYYAADFELRKVLALKDVGDNVLDADFKAFLTNNAVRAKYQSLRSLYSEAFQTYAAQLGADKS